MASWEHDFDLTYTKLILERLAHAPRADVKPVIARRRSEHGSGVGRLRRVVDRRFALAALLPSPRLRWERRPEIHAAFMHLGRAIICQRYLRAVPLVSPRW